MVKHIPNLITCLNLAAGFISIILIINGNAVTASWLILLAMLFDFLDGFSARLLNEYSEMGKELDSLADVVSFGIAPGLIIYSLMINIINTESSFFFLNYHKIATAIIILISSFMAVCGALRLAKFNIDTEQSTSFKGLPIPANALGVISIVLSANFSQSELLLRITKSPVILILISLSLSVLMISRLNLISLKFESYGIKGNEHRYVLILISVVSLILAGIAALPLIIPFYIIISVIGSNRLQTGAS
jgi:CDP-diacylglycerol---serine O-phosphatidyltransferase